MNSMKCIILATSGKLGFTFYVRKIQIVKSLTADKCARKHICGHLCGMEGNNA